MYELDKFWPMSSFFLIFKILDHLNVEFLKIKMKSIRDIK